MHCNTTCHQQRCLREVKAKNSGKLAGMDHPRGAARKLYDAKAFTTSNDGIGVTVAGT